MHARTKNKSNDESHESFSFRGCLHMRFEPFEIDAVFYVISRFFNIITTTVECKNLAESKAFAVSDKHNKTSSVGRLKSGSLVT